MLSQIARCVVRRASRNGTRGYHGPPVDFKPPTMNELPVPQGSWQADYNRRQTAYNLQLAAGLILITGTISFIVCSDKFFFNAFPPVPKEEKDKK
ncbi:uncharacterized protein LOC117175055 [Belonocnema kinseyi]|uniref:uncharacterized protein LOC117175055 n=1 Tax=Belonocnema kinseyi TaxID=2817044 RepID=UPI00143CD84F|nr:uncharacterized protein LOC117175055 [Belonocnema kinseyi]